MSERTYDGGQGPGGGHPVVVVGGGPVGLMLACELRRAGTGVLVLEQRTSPYPLPRAGSMGPLAFEALERLGLREALLTAEQDTLAEYARMFADWEAKTQAAQGGTPGGPATRKAPKEHFAGLERIDPTRRTDPDRRRVRVEQPVLEDILRRRARELGAELRHGHTVTGVRQDEERVVIDVRGPGGGEDPAGTQDRGEPGGPGGRYTVPTQYLVGCDGADSTVRRLAGFDFPGTSATVTGRMAVVEMADAEKLAPGFHATPVGLYVHGLGLNRLSTVEFDGPPPDGAGELTLSELQDSIRRVSGTDVTLTRMSSGARWIDTARQASAYRIGRVLLAGDAAHVYAPVGGQGLNVGLVDAANLGWKLAAQVGRRAPHHLLDSYTAERHPVAARLLANTRAQIALMRPDPQTRALREMFDGLLGIDEVHRGIADMMAGMDVRYALGGGHALVGTLCADMKLSGPAGATRLSELWGGGCGVLLDLAGRAEVRATAEPWSARVRTVTAAAEGHETEGLDALLLRPDGCVAWALPAAAPLDADLLADALGAWFGDR
ncbi:FAD-dependent monooxygenase [Streptomyces sp. NPDC050560]|uniref:FAD-dependent monooxygenase n=1 Tax=Streptomyces sp. NPDC050560 TaxID=3365630 RepID=UPI00378802B6